MGILRNKFFFITLFAVTIFTSHALKDQATRLRGLRNARLFDKTNSNKRELWDPTIWVDDVEVNEENEVEPVGEKEHDRVTHDNNIDGLPGQPKSVSFQQYAGYVNVQQSKGRHLFYYFVEALHFPNKKPLLLWLNGGPGCSSLGYGAMQEIGPFGVNPDGKTLFIRHYSWNNVANILFLESPTSVGFSFSNDTSDYDNLGDHNTARDTYTFLLKWLKRFPEYKGRDFYIAGESYAGVYIPQLADLIRHKNNKAGKHIIPLKGIMMGNAVMNDFTDDKGTYDYLWSHALISDETHNLIMKNCFKSSLSKYCIDLKIDGDEETGNIDLYAIYAPICQIDPDINATLPVSPPLQKQGSYDPCEENYILSYLNLPHVQKALHANPTSWIFCSSPTTNWKDRTHSMFRTYNRLIDANIKILVFSGDTDSIVSVTSTRYSLAALNLTVVKPWKAWMEDNNQDVGGYKVVYEGLTFATVRNAGHEVPLFQANRAFTLFKSFLA